MIKLRLHPEALADMDELWDYIAEDSPANADRVYDNLEAAMMRLLDLPHQGFKRPDLTDRPLRFILVHQYLIAYAPDESPLHVIAVFHGKRHPQLLAALLRERH